MCVVCVSFPDRVRLVFVSCRLVNQETRKPGRVWLAQFVPGLPAYRSTDLLGYALRPVCISTTRSNPDRSGWTRIWAVGKNCRARALADWP